MTTGKVVVFLHRGKEGIMAKGIVKKCVATGMALATVVSVSACGSSATASNSAKATDAAVEKPEKIKVMADTSVIKESNGAQAFYDQLKEATGIDVEWIRPDHSGYYDAVGNAFNNEDDMPDVVYLSSGYYAMYAANGMLWNMTDAWNNSEVKKSGRLKSSADDIYQSLMVNGDDGQKGLYGLATISGGGSFTYVRESWLKAAGYSRSDVEGKTLTFDQYYEMLTKMHQATGKCVISAPGYVGGDTPYTNYLPEFYQNAHYSFYENSEGKFVDGFTEQDMKDALGRIAKGVADGIIDQETINNTTTDAREKFFGSNTGVFTYWAGDWAQTLQSTLDSRGDSDSMVILDPIQELGKYTEIISNCWCITSTAENPEGIFEYWLSKMMDGGDIQTLWTYGAKGTHWDTKAETVTLQGSDQSTTYEEGTFHFLPSPEKPSVLQQKNDQDPTVAISNFTNGDPGEDAVSKVSRDTEDYFLAHAKLADPLPFNEVLGDNISDINKERSLLVASVASGSMTVDQAMTEYTSKVGSLVQEVLDSMNK